MITRDLSIKLCDFRGDAAGAFGLCRTLKEQTGTIKVELIKDGHKSVQNERAILVPGSRQEVDVVQYIYPP